MDAGGLLKGAPALPAPAPAEPLLDLTRRVWSEGDLFYRFNWILQYRSGEIRRQYERKGQTVFQTWFSRIPHHGVARIEILEWDHPFRGFAIPEDAEVDILYDVTFTPGTGKSDRIFIFGYVRPLPLSPLYFHIDPRFDPPRRWWSPFRFL